MQDRIKKFLAPLPVTEMLVPDSAKVQDTVAVYLKAEAPNGCWKFIVFNLDQNGSFDYEASALGAYEGFGICPAVWVTRDTTIDILPGEKGTFIFTANENGFRILADTLVVY